MSHFIIVRQWSRPTKEMVESIVQLYYGHLQFSCQAGVTHPHIASP